MIDIKDIRKRNNSYYQDPELIEKAVIKLKKIVEEYCSTIKCVKPYTCPKCYCDTILSHNAVICFHCGYTTNIVNKPILEYKKGITIGALKR